MCVSGQDVETLENAAAKMLADIAGSRVSGLGFRVQGLVRFAILFCGPSAFVGFGLLV